MGEVTKDIELLHKDEYSYKTITQYVQDMYRFFKLNSSGKLLNDIFTKSFSPIGTELFDSVINTPKEKRKVAEYFFAKNYFRQAYETFENISGSDPDCEVFQKMGYAMMKSGDYEKALDNFLKALLFDDRQPWTLKKTAFCYRKLKNPEKAIEYYKLAEAQDNDNLAVAAAIGRCYMDMENYTEALKYFFKVDYLDASNFKNCRPLAWCSYKAGKYEQALKYSQKPPEKEKIAEDYILQANIYRKFNDIEKAVAAYEKALEFENYTVENLENAIKKDYALEESDPEYNNLLFDYIMYKNSKQL